MFADAAQRLMRLYGVRPGRARRHRDGEPLRLRGGARPRSTPASRSPPIVDLDAGRRRDAAAAAAERAACASFTGSTLVDARRQARVVAVAVDRITGEGTTSGRPRVDRLRPRRDERRLLAALNLASHAGAHVVFDEAIDMHRAVDLPPGVRLAGCGGVRRMSPASTIPGRSSPARRPRTSSTSTRTCRSKDIVNTVEDGYDDIQLVKRYSTVGLGPSQGRHANLNTIRLVARGDRQVDRAQSARRRSGRRWCRRNSPHLAGRGLRAGAPHRDAWPPSRARCADDGRRPVAAPRLLRRKGGCRAQRSRREVAAVRARRRHDRRLDARRPRHSRARCGRVRRPHVHVGLCEAAGRPRPLCADDRPDRRRHRRRRRLPPARAPLLRHGDDRRRRSGLSADDCGGTRNGGSTSTSPTSRPPMRASTSPARRRATVLAEASRATSISPPTAFPYMAVRQGTLGGIPVRVLRVGFVGELGYEIHCPSSRGDALWDMLDGGRRAHRHPAVRRRGAAHAAAREGPHHRRPGHRRPDPSGRGRHGVGARQEEAVLCRQARRSTCRSRRA